MPHRITTEFVSGVEKLGRIFFFLLKCPTKDSRCMLQTMGPVDYGHKPDNSFVSMYVCKYVCLSVCMYV